MVDRRALIESAKAKAKLAKESAKGKAQIARHEAAAAKRRRQNPPPVYVNLPEPSGDAVKDTRDELTALQAGFRQRAKDEGKRFMEATDSEYWCCLCFQTREQKEAFLTALQLIQFGDKYLDGQLVAKQLGVPIPAADVPFNTGSKVDPKWHEFT